VVRALEDSELLAVSLPVLRQLMERDGTVGRLLGDGANLGADIASWAACDLLISDGAQRIAAVLLRVTGVLDGLPPDQPGGFLLTQQDLGEMANASRHHVNRVLRMMKRAGWIATSYNHIRLLDVPGLTAFAHREGGARTGPDI
jgi:CRP/FNR family transcriptional regulator, cyclic AMP receptor protein